MYFVVWILYWGKGTNKRELWLEHLKYCALILENSASLLI